MSDDDFADLFRAHHNAILAYGLRRVDGETARDVMSETFLVAVRRLDQVPPEPRAWLLAVARRVLANELRRRARAESLGQRVARAAAFGGVPTVQPDHAEQVAATHGVLAALAQLSPRDQEVLQLTAWEGLSELALSEVLECSPATARVRLHRARRRLAALLQENPTSPAPLRQPRRRPEANPVRRTDSRIVDVTAHSPLASSCFGQELS